MAAYCFKNIHEQFLKSEHDITKLAQELQDACTERGYDLPKSKHVEWLLEQAIRPYNKNNCPLSKFEIHGTRERWLQAGDVFVVFVVRILVKATPDEIQLL